MKINFCQMSSDLLFGILEKLDINDIHSLCLMNKTCEQNICLKDTWKKIIRRKYPQLADYPSQFLTEYKQTWFHVYETIIVMNDIYENFEDIFDIILMDVREDLFYMWSKIYLGHYDFKKYEQAITQYLSKFLTYHAYFLADYVSPTFWQDNLKLLAKYGDQQWIEFLKHRNITINDKQLLHDAITTDNLKLFTYLIPQYIKPTIAIANYVLSVPYINNRYDMLKFLAGFDIFPTANNIQYLKNIYDPDLLNWLQQHNIYSADQIGRRKLNLPISF